VGPNLNQLKPDKARVQNAIEKGGAGTGAMPANIVTGEEAEAVATYVSSVAGQ
jgi:mono/diheme cytochrome c family protein